MELTRDTHAHTHTTSLKKITKSSRGPRFCLSQRFAALRPRSVAKSLISCRASNDSSPVYAKAIFWLTEKCEGEKKGHLLAHLVRVHARLRSAYGKLQQTPLTMSVEISLQRAFLVINNSRTAPREKQARKFPDGLLFRPLSPL